VSPQGPFAADGDACDLFRGVKILSAEFESPPIFRFRDSKQPEKRPVEAIGTDLWLPPTGYAPARAWRGAVSYSLRHARRNCREDEKPARSATRSMSRRV